MRRRNCRVFLAGMLAWVPAAQAQEVPSATAVSVVRHVVEPAVVVPGELALQTLEVTAPEGVQLSVADVVGRPEVERRGAWRIARRPGSPEGVVWTLQAPLTAWQLGAHRAPGVRLEARSAQGLIASELLAGPAFAARSPVPSDARVARPALPEGVPDVGPGWPVALAFAPLLLLVGTGVARWGGRTTVKLERVSAARFDWTTLVRTELDRVGSDPAGVAVSLARAARRQPEALALGITDAHTTTEVLTALGRAKEPRRWVALADALFLADAVKFGGYAPSRDDVVRVGQVLLSQGEADA